MANPLTQAVRQLAREQYNVSYGWSVIEECWTDKEISEEIAKHDFRTLEQVIAHFTDIADLHTERYEEARAEIF